MSREYRWVFQGAAIARIELVRDYRTFKQNSLRIALLVLATIFGGLYLGLMAVLTYVGGTVARGESGLSVPVEVSAMIVVLWMSFAAMFAVRAAMRTTEIDGSTILLTTVPSEAVAVGLLVAEYVRALAFVLLPVALLGGGFVLGSRTPMSMFVIPVATGLFIASSLCCGYTVGMYGRLLAHRFTGTTKHLLTAGSLVGMSLTLLVVIFLGNEANFESATAFPMSWYGDLFFIGAPLTISLERAVGAIGGSVLSIGICGVAVRRFANELWYDTSITGERLFPQSGTPKPMALTQDVVDTRYLSQGTCIVARKTLFRVLRRPSTRSYLLFPLFIAALLVVEALQTADARPLLPIVMILVGVWFSGALVTLNPLGEEGTVLQQTVLTPLTGEQFIRGKGLLGVVLGLPVTVFAVVVASYGTYSFVETGVVVTIAIVHTLAAIGIAAGVGTGLPRFGALRVGSRRRIVPPSLSAITVYTIAVTWLGGLVAGVAVFPTVIDGVLSLSREVMVVSTVVVVGLDAAVGYGCYRYAVRQFDQYTVS